MKPARVLTLALLLAAVGCRSEFFSESGTMASTGNYRNTWNWHPQGCTRDPFDGLPVGESKSIVTLLWENPGVRDPTLGSPEKAPDAPLRLEFTPAPGAAAGEVAATLHTIDNPGLSLDNRVCSTLRLRTHEHSAAHPGGRPMLSGELHLDCRVNDSHYTADLEFSHCEY
jgi:hypothetical protein